MNYNQLKASSELVTPKYNVDNLAHVRINDLVYDENAETEDFYMEVRSSRPGAGGYSIQIRFLNVGTNDGLTEEEIQQGYNPKPSLSKNDVMVSCTCDSYRFRFNEANKGMRVGLNVKFPPYITKTSRAPNNPQQRPGMCKHIMEAMNYLNKQGFLNA